MQERTDKTRKQDRERQQRKRLRDRDAATVTATYEAYRDRIATLDDLAAALGPDWLERLSDSGLYPPDVLGVLAEGWYIVEAGCGGNMHDIMLLGGRTCSWPSK